LYPGGSGREKQERHFGTDLCVFIFENDGEKEDPFDGWPVFWENLATSISTNRLLVWATL
jgi:hypothetical protein